MSYLIVVAHPDDEVLGCGATIKKLTLQGKEVNVCILSGEVSVRKHRPSIEILNNNIDSSSKILGINKIIKGDFPNIAFNSVEHVKLVQFIETAIVETGAQVVITHHPSDLNNDHLHTTLACQAAVRLFQRNKHVRPIKELLFMEVPSATDWSLNTAVQPFRPNVFIAVGKELIMKKVNALYQYKGIMREFPHPRSNEGILGLASMRGGQSGTEYAEAFESVFRRIE